MDQQIITTNVNLPAPKPILKEQIYAENIVACEAISTDIREAIKKNDVILISRERFTKLKNGYDQARVLQVALETLGEQIEPLLQIVEPIIELKKQYGPHYINLGKFRYDIFSNEMNETVNVAKKMYEDKNPFAILIMLKDRFEAYFKGYIPDAQLQAEKELSQKDLYQYKRLEDSAKRNFEGFSDGVKEAIKKEYTDSVLNCLQNILAEHQFPPVIMSLIKAYTLADFEKLKEIEPSVFAKICEKHLPELHAKISNKIEEVKA